MNQITPAQHYASRKAVSPAHGSFHTQTISDPLYVVIAYFNPQRYQSRQKLALRFIKHCEDAGAIPYVVELALRDRHHEITQHDNPQHIQLWGESELWYKENLQNVGVKHLPQNWKYVLLPDADFLFTRADWAEEILHMLQHYQAVQPYKFLTYETHDHRPLSTMPSFAYMHLNGMNIPDGGYSGGRPGTPGGAWAFRRSAFAQIGGMLETCILGSGDWHMAHALALRPNGHAELKQLSQGYRDSISRWTERAKILKGNIGCCDTHAIHFWHGPMKNRQYITRPQILKNNGFDPYTDLMHDEHGVLQLTGNKPKLRDDIRSYFKQRNEDELAPPSW